MPKGTGWRISLIGIFVLLSFLYLTPTLVATLPSWWKGLLPKDKIHLGLDLQGGTHLVLEVDTQKAVEGTLDIVATDLEDTLNSKNMRFKRIARTGSDKVSVVLYEKGTAESVQKLLKDKYPGYEQGPAHDDGGFVAFELRINDKDAQDRKDKAVQQALESAPTVIGPATLTALRAREAAWRDIEHRYGYLTAQDIGDLAGSRSKNRTEYASARLREGKLAAVRRAGRLLFPAFQFERSTGHPITELAAILDVFHAADWDDESILLWFTAPNGRLADKAL